MHIYIQGCNIKQWQSSSLNIFLFYLFIVIYIFSLSDLLFSNLFLFILICYNLMCSSFWFIILLYIPLYDLLYTFIWFVSSWYDDVDNVADLTIVTVTKIFQLKPTSFLGSYFILVTCITAANIATLQKKYVRQFSCLNKKPTHERLCKLVGLFKVIAI